MNENNNYSEYTNSVFEQPWWLNIVAPGKWKELLQKNDNEVISRYVVVINDKNRLFMPRMTQNIGIWIKPDLLIKDNSYKNHRKIYSHYANEVNKYKTFSIRLNTINQYILPFIWMDNNITPSISYRLNELDDLDSIFQNFNPNIRRRIRNATENLIIEESDDIEHLLKLYEKTFDHQKRKVPIKEKQLIKRIYQGCKINNACKLLYIKDKDNNYYSGGLFVYDEKIMYNLITGTDPQYRNSGANSLLLWEAIKICSKISKIFDFEGSNIESIEDFFRQFGGIPSIYFSIEKRNLFQHIFKYYRRKIKRLIGYKQ